VAAQVPVDSRMTAQSRAESVGLLPVLARPPQKVTNRLSAMIYTVSKPIYSIPITTYATAANRLNSQKYA